MNLLIIAQFNPFLAHCGHRENKTETMKCSMAWLPYVILQWQFLLLYLLPFWKWTSTFANLVFCWKLSFLAFNALWFLLETNSFSSCNLWILWGTQTINVLDSVKNRPHPQNWEQSFKFNSYFLKKISNCICLHTLLSTRRRCGLRFYLLFIVLIIQILCGTQMIF